MRRLAALLVNHGAARRLRGRVRTTEVRRHHRRIGPQPSVGRGFLPNGIMLLTERSGRLSRIVNVVASGAIDATGEDVVISDTEDLFIFPDGTLTVIHAPVRGKEHFNDKKCTGSFRETGTYVISEGTGQYEGVTGSGSYQAVGRFEDACGPEAPTGTFTITARGSINLPNA